MTKSVTIQVADIGCTGCVSDLETILMGTDGILSVAIRYSEDSIKIEYDPELLSEERIVTAIRKMGLKPREAKGVHHPSERPLP